MTAESQGDLQAGALDGSKGAQSLFANQKINDFGKFGLENTTFLHRKPITLWSKIYEELPS